MSAAVKATGQLLDSSGNAINSFLKLFKDFNVIGFVLGLLIANGVAEIAQAFIDGIIMPTAKPILDRISSKSAEVRIGGFTLHLEKFLKAIFKFMALTLIIFLLVNVGVNMNKPVTWVRVVGQYLKGNLM